MHTNNRSAYETLARSLGHRAAEVGAHRRGTVRRRAQNRVRGRSGRRSLRMGQAGPVAFSAIPQTVDSCYDIATGTIVGGTMDGITPHPTTVDLYTDGAGYERAKISVSGDNHADLPVCDTGEPGSLSFPPPGAIPPPVIPPPRIPPPRIPPPGVPDDDWCPPTECTTYGSPPVIVGPDGCDIGYNGCGDTIGVLAPLVAFGATVDVNIPAAIEFTPRYFIYTGTVGAFTIDRVFVANGPNSNFGAGYNAAFYALTSFTSKRVSWPTFYNSPPLTLTVTNVFPGGSPEDFAGLLIGIAAHQ